jgi:hypothetical protein
MENTQTAATPDSRFISRRCRMEKFEGETTVPKALERFQTGYKFEREAREEKEI